MTRGVETAKLDKGGVADLTEEAIAELFDGAPESFSDPGPETIPAEPIVFDEPIGSDDKVLLTNVHHTEEEVFLTDPVTHSWNGEKVQFINGRLYTDRQTADYVKQACPYVFEENTNLPWLDHKEGKFRTTSTEAYTLFSRLFAENR